MIARRISTSSVKDKHNKDEDEEDESDEEEEEEEGNNEISDSSDSNSETNGEDLSQISDEEANDEAIEDQPSRAGLCETKSRETNQAIYTIIQRYLFMILLVPIFAVLLLNCSTAQLFSQSQDTVEEGREIQLNLAHVDELDRKYPKLLSSKEMRTIKTRLAVMRREVSILMLLGKSKDIKCKSDPTFCIGQTIANVTQVQYGYIDASNPQIKSNEIEQELTESLGGNRHAVMIDSLEKLPGTQVMSLFQFIDKDETHKRKGMLLFVVYTGTDDRDDDRAAKMRDADIAESILFAKWSPSIPKDSLTSVISRICGSIVKVY